MVILVSVLATNIYADDSFKLITSSCQRGLDFDGIEEFHKFIEVFRQVKSFDRDSKIPYDCRTGRQAILDLEQLVVKDDVCDRSKVTKLIDYHKKYMAPKGFLLGPSNKVVTSKFFQKYAIQVAYTCKKNLIRNLRRAQEELKALGRVLEEAKEKVYMQEPTIKANMDLLEERLDDPSSANVKPSNDVELGLNEYREALTKLSRPEDILTFDPDDCRSNQNREIKVSSDKVSIFFKPILMCHQLHRYFGGSILSIARLANYGYMAIDEELDAELLASATIRDWIVATQVCDPMVYMKSSISKDEWTFVDTCANEVEAIEVLVFDDDIEELEVNKLEQFIPKSEATRSHAQRLMKSALRKMAKIDLMRQISEDTSNRSIFKKSLRALASRRKSIGSMGVKQEFMVKLQDDLSKPISPTATLDQVELYKGEFKQPPIPEQEAFKLLEQMVSEGQETSRLQAQCGLDRSDQPVSFEVMSHVASIATILAIMITFEWIFFIVMTLAARLCHHLYFNFEHMLTFPPKILSWSDADFARLTDKMNKMDEDDYLDFEELSQQEQEQRLLLAKVFGNPPPMLYKDY